MSITEQKWWWTVEIILDFIFNLSEILYHRVKWMSRKRLSLLRKIQWIYSCPQSFEIRFPISLEIFGPWSILLFYYRHFNKGMLCVAEYLLEGWDKFAVHKCLRWVFYNKIDLTYIPPVLCPSWYISFKDHHIFLLNPQHDFLIW